LVQDICRINQGRIVFGSSGKGFYFKGRTLEFTELVLKGAPEPIIPTHHQLFFHERPLETEQHPPGTCILYIDLEVFGPLPEIEPIMGHNLHHGTYGSSVKILERYVPTPILPGSRVVTEERSYTAYTPFGKGMQSNRPHSFKGVDGHGKFPEKHVLL
jgi:hypothetical protein